MLALVFPAAAKMSDDVSAALKHAGANRSELETAMSKVKGKDTEYLLTHASQYDLVNLTSQQIIENITYARKVHVALPYLGKKIDDELWREWVLPQRVLDEDLDLWRKDFYEQILREDPPVRLTDDKSKETCGKFNTWAFHRQHDKSVVPPNPGNLSAGEVLWSLGRNSES